MLKLSRNHSMPVSSVSTTTTAPLGKKKRSSIPRPHTNSFSIPSINFSRSATDKSDVSLAPGSHPTFTSSSPSSTSAAASSSSHAMVDVLYATVISDIHRGNFLQLSDTKLDALIRFLAGKDSTTLQTINIKTMVISATDARLLARLVRSSEAANIRTLKLDRNTISQDAFKLLFEAFKYNRTITTLSMTRASVDDKAIKAIAKAVEKSTTLKELDLSSNRITALGCEILCEALVCNRSLTRLCLQSNNFKKPGATPLAMLLRKNRVLRHLNVGSNGLGTEGCVMIAEAVRFNRSLSSLSLDLNEMGALGATAMAIALVSNRNLTYLYIPHNNIGEEGLIKICASLKRNTTLVGLDLELNHIGSGQSIEGMKALAEVLRTNTSLRDINLSYNILSSEAVQELMKGVAANSTLESIVCTNCCISTEGAMAIAEVLPSARGLQNLGLTANPDILVDGYWALAQGLSKNRSMKGIQLDYNSEDRHTLYESIQHSLTRNFIWQQALYSAACHILTLSRVVLLGRPVQQRMLMSQQLQLLQQQSSGGAWNLLKRVGLLRTNSAKSSASLLSIGKSQAAVILNDPGDNAGGRRPVDAHGVFYKGSDAGADLSEPVYPIARSDISVVGRYYSEQRGGYYADENIMS
ncbi:hypothetical protein BC939DRAFT_478060 [Gamsiella multidivaricata]|uniref:uncharacterized protein n=1 Tax=Gamsiella multidivaricata TaxID=101098 RepID=UPI002220AC4E|nr:uncharacterized protein BC939DRAFT_478060 [Gamsiella multidivaricata]KAI7821867.1 hypothetical protein BC939DRAFT_478060 [Gamsiella multidivaricata]